MNSSDFDPPPLPVLNYSQAPDHFHYNIVGWEWSGADQGIISNRQRWWIALIYLCFVLN